MTDALAVADAVAALRARNDAHADIFQKAHDALTRPAGHVPPLVDYLRIIKDEPIEWLRTLPDGWKCLSYFHKARAAVNALIAIQDVADAIHREDPDLLPALRTTIRTRLKSQHMHAVARERAGLPAADPDDPDPDDQSSLDPADVCARMKQACFDFCRATHKHALLAVLTAFWDDACRDDALAVDVGRLVFMDSPPIAVLDAFLRARRGQ